VTLQGAHHHFGQLYQDSTVANYFFKFNLLGLQQWLFLVLLVIMALSHRTACKRNVFHNSGGEPTNNLSTTKTAQEKERGQGTLQRQVLTFFIRARCLSADLLTLEASN
jgi:hypothetical protein